MTSEGVSCWPTSNRNCLPGRPLAQAISRMAAAGDDRDELIGALLDRADVDPRDLYRWQVGEGNPTLATVDRVLTRLGLMWWDVWNEDTVREPVLIVRSYRWRMFRCERRMYCLRKKQYGDLGTDFWALRRVTDLLADDLPVAA